MRSVHFNTAFPPDLLAELREAAALEGLTVGALVRRAVRWELRRLQLTRDERESLRGPTQPRPNEATA